MSAAIDLAYVGLGLHEQLVAHVAQRLGYFEDSGVQVTLRDGRAWTIEQLRSVAVVGLGRTQVSRLRDGVPWVVRHVNTDRPMFWILASSDIQSMSDLRGHRLAVHAAHSAPGIWTRIVLRRNGLDPDADLTTVDMEADNYDTRLTALKAGTVDAVVVGSTHSPDVLVRDRGLNVLCCIGDQFRIPTTGVAVDPTRINLDGPAVAGLVHGHRRALATIHEDPRTAILCIQDLLPGLDTDDATSYLNRHIAPHFRGDGIPGLDVVASALSVLAAELGVSPPARVDDIYRIDDHPRQVRSE